MLISILTFLINITNLSDLVNFSLLEFLKDNENINNISFIFNIKNKIFNIIFSLSYKLYNYMLLFIMHLFLFFNAGSSVGWYIYQIYINYIYLVRKIYLFFFATIKWTKKVSFGHTHFRRFFFIILLLLLLFKMWAQINRKYPIVLVIIFYYIINLVLINLFIDSSFFFVVNVNIYYLLYIQIYILLIIKYNFEYFIILLLILLNLFF